MGDHAELVRSAVTLDVIQRKLGLKGILSHYDANPKTPPEPTATKRRKRPAVARHTRKCNVCRHPEREAIEDGFLCWQSPDALAEEYGIADHSSIYRHVHATGIFARRRANLRMALEPLIECAQSVRVTANALINAVRLHASINDDGQFIKPPTRHIVIVKYDPPLPPEADAGQPALVLPSPLAPCLPRARCKSAKGHSPLPTRVPRVRRKRAKGHSPLATSHSPIASSNRQTPRIETTLTHRKQTTATRSNRQNFGLSKSRSRRTFLPRAAASGIVKQRDERGKEPRRAT